MSLVDPAAFLRLIWDSKYDWKFLTTPQSGVAGEPVMFPRCVFPLLGFGTVTLIRTIAEAEG